MCLVHLCAPAGTEVTVKVTVKLIKHEKYVLEKSYKLQMYRELSS